MRHALVIGLAAIAGLQFTAAACHAQMADPKAAAAPLAGPSATGQVIQAQLHAPGPAPRTSGAEANDLYKRYQSWLGHPMVITEDSGAGMSGQGHPVGGQ